MLAGNDAQKKKYLGRMTEDPLMCVSNQPLVDTSESMSTLVDISELGFGFRHFSSILWTSYTQF